jgi:hypothetical protein
MGRKSPEGYPSFDFESAEHSPAGSPPPAEGEHKEKWGPSHIEVNDECPMCAHQYESEGFCVACVTNEKKREYLAHLKK